MALSVTAVPGKQFADTETVTIPKLNQLGQPTFTVTGTVATSDIADAAVTGVKTKCDAHFYTASVARAASGLGGVADKYTLTFSNSIGPASLADGVIVAFKVNSTCTGRVAVDAGVGGEKEVKKNYNGNIGAGDLVQNQIVVVRYDSTNGVWQLLSPLGRASVVAIIGSGRNIVSKNNGAAPATQIDIAADSLVLMDTSNNGFLATSVSVTINSQTTGANALDTGVLAAGWYYTYVIYNGTTVAGLMSTSSTTPSMPTGYTYKALVGAVYATGVSDIRRFYQTDRHVSILHKNIFSAKQVAAGSTYEVLSGADLTAFRTAVPPIARRFQGIFGIPNTSNGLAVAVAACDDNGAADTSNSIGASLLRTPAPSATWTPQAFNSIAYGAAASFECPVRGGAQYNFQWQASANTVNHILDVTGFVL